jgi:hypothetical protein
MLARHIDKTRAPAMTVRTKPSVRGAVSFQPMFRWNQFLGGSFGGSAMWRLAIGCAGSSRGQSTTA